MKTTITEEAVPFAVKCDVWYSQIKAAMPEHQKLHIVGKNLLAFLDNNNLGDKVHEVRTDNSWVGFKILFSNSVYGRDMKKLLEYVDFSWIKVENGFLSMTVCSDDLVKSYLDHDE
jgi:hypothetical protein